MTSLASFAGVLWSALSDVFSPFFRGVAEEPVPFTTNEALRPLCEGDRLSDREAVYLAILNGPVPF